jgi:SpoVK/Ycf46/Vps4 family AAA+-type ATPase
MQDRNEPVFVVATANDVSGLPPELLRKGRFDEIFFVDLPKFPERKKIFEIHLEKRGRNPKFFKVNKLAEMTESFTGAEIESLIEASLYEAFSDNKRDITDEDLVISIQNLVPISKLMKEEINALRSWATERARNASTIDFPSGSIDVEEEDL